MRKRLYRSRTDRMLSGVAGGMAHWLDLDPSVVRIVWALLVLAGGTGLVLYIVAAIVVPEEPLEGVDAASGSDDPGVTSSGGASGATPAPNVMSGHGPTARHENTGALVFGAVLVFAGAWFLVRQYIPQFDDKFVWPSVLVVIGIFLIAGAMRRR